MYYLIVAPNPFQDVSAFKRNLIIDLIIDGNIFIYYDGAHLYHLPADKVKIYTDDKTFVEKYEFDSTIEYSVNEIIHVKENSFNSIYRGVPIETSVQNNGSLGQYEKFSR